MSKEQLQNLEFSVSHFHQEMMELGVKVLQEKKVKQDDLGMKIRSIWGEDPIIVADYRHAFLNPWAYAVVGDLLFAKFLKRTEFTKKGVFHLLFEPHPTGIGSIDLVVPNGEGLSKIELSPATANIFTSEAFTEDVLKGYFYFLQDKYHHWREFRENLGMKIEGSNLPNREKIKNHCQENLDRLKVIYDEVIKKWLNEGSLNDFAMDINRRLVFEIFGVENISHLPEWQSYRSSDFAAKLWRTLEVFQNTSYWDAILATLFTERKGEQFLFVGGDARMRRWVDYGIKGGFSLKEARVDARIGRPKGIPIDNASLLEYLKDRTLIPTNVIIAVVLACVSEYLPVIRDGNDYGKKNKAAQCWHGQTYHQLFGDYQDGWPAVRFTRENHVDQEDPHLASLFIWNPGGDFYQEALRESLATGIPKRINLEDLAERF